MADPQVELTNGHGDAERIDLANTQIKPPTGELGSAYDRDRIFTRYDDGKYFETRDIWTSDFETMLRLDGKARTLEQVLSLPLMSAEHQWEGAKGDKGELDFIEQAFEQPANAGGMSVPLKLVIGQMTSACVFRRAFFEKVFRADGGRVYYDKLAFRPASTCYLLRDKNDYSFRGIKQRFLKNMNLEEVVIPANKSFVYLHNQHRDPLNGTSDLETAYTIFQSKQKLRFIWYSFLENQAMQKAIAQHSNNDDNEIQQFAQKVATLKGGGVVGISPDQSVDVFPGGDGTEFKNAMAYLDGEMAGSCLSAFTELPSAAQLGRGSYALAESATDFFMESRRATLDEMAASFTSWVVADLVRYNFGPDAAVPTFKFKPPAQDSTEHAFQLLQAMANTPGATSMVPKTFIDLLTEKVAGYLNLDVGQVHEAITTAQQGAQNPTQGMQQGIAAATQLVQQGLGQQQAQGAAANLSTPVDLGEPYPGQRYRHGWIPLGPKPVEDVHIRGKGDLIYTFQWRRGADTPGTWNKATVVANSPTSAESKLRSHLTQQQYSSGYEVGDLLGGERFTNQHQLADLERAIEETRVRLGEVEGSQSGRVVAPIQRKLDRLLAERDKLRAP